MMMLSSAPTCTAEATSSRITAVLLALATSTALVGCGGEIGAAEDSSAEIGTSSSDVTSDQDAFAADEEANYVGETYLPTVGGGGGETKGVPCFKGTDHSVSENRTFCEQYDRCDNAETETPICVTIDKCRRKVEYSTMRACVRVDDEENLLGGKACGMVSGLWVGCDVGDQCVLDKRTGQPVGRCKVFRRNRAECGN